MGPANRLASQAKKPLHGEAAEANDEPMRKSMDRVGNACQPQLQRREQCETIDKKGVKGEQSPSGNNA